MNSHATVTLIVRIWLEPSEPRGVWRASVTDTRTQEKRYFQDPMELARFMTVNHLSMGK